MTVQSINKRVVPEANMTPASQDKSQADTSVEDAFVAMLQQVGQRYGAKLGSAATNAADAALSDHLARAQVDAKSDKPQAKADDKPSQRATAAKEPRAAGKADKPRQAKGSDDSRKADASAPAAAATSSSSDDDSAPAAADDDQAVSTKDDTAPAAAANDQQAKTASADDAAANAAAVQQKVEVEIDVTVVETVTTVEVVTGPQTAQVDPNQQAQQLMAQVNAGQNAGDAKDPLAGLSKDDRQRIVDLQKQIVSDLEGGDADDALAAATEMVSQLVAKAGLQQTSAQNLHQGKVQTDTAHDQAKDLADMLAGTGAQIQVNVQVTQAVQADTPQSQTAQALLDAQAQMEAASQAQVVVDPNAGRGGQDQGQTAGNQADANAALTPTAAAAPTTPVVEDIPKVFSAVLAAQVSAADQAAEVKPEQPQISGIGQVSQPQAASQASSAQSTAQTARAPRVPLQQQVMDQVNVQIDKAVKDGNDVVKIQLKPHELGKIEIKLEVSADGHVTATVTAEKPETLALLQKDSKGLDKALENAGLKTDGSSTSFNLKGNEHQQNADRGNNNQRQGRGRSGGPDLGDDQLAGPIQAAQARTLGGRSGVDISV